MRFVDFAIQGFLDLRGAGQIRFGSALTAVASAPSAPTSVLSGLLEALFSEGYDPAAIRLASPGAESTRAVVTVQSADGSVFRLVRDIVRGSAQLLGYEGGDFAPVASDAGEIAQFLRGRVGLPRRDVYEQAFVLRAGDLPSTRSAPVSRGPAIAAQSVGPQGPPELTAQERAGLENRLKQLRRAIQAHESVKALEYELDGLQKRSFDLETEIARRDMDTTAVDEAEHRFQTFCYLEELPEDFPIRVEFYLEAKQRRERDLERWEQERDNLERDSRTIEVEPVVTDWRLWAGLAVGAGALASGFVLQGPLQLLALADIPAFGLSAFVLWQHLISLELRDNTRRKLELSDRRKELIETRDESEIVEVENAVAEVGHEAADVEEVVQRLEGLHVAKAELESARRAYAEATNDPELHRMKAEYEEVRRAIGDMEVRLASSSLGGEASRVRDEIDELEMQLNGNPAKAMTRAASAPGLAPVGADEPEGPLSEFLSAASELLMVGVEQTADKVNRASQPLLHSLSGGALSEPQLDRKGGVLVRSGNEVRTLLALPPATQDVVYVALRGGLLSCLDERMRAPFLICDLESALPAGARFVIALASMLAQHNQTVCLSREAAPGWPDGTTVAAFQTQ